jgi:hypothetical protein
VDHGSNFPGVRRVKRLLAAGTHVLIRVKDGITLRRAGAFLPDRSYLAVICGGGITLTVRVTEYYVRIGGQDAPELFCLITECATRRCMSGWRWETVHFSAVVAA